MDCKQKVLFLLMFLNGIAVPSFSAFSNHVVMSRGFAYVLGNKTQCFKLDIMMF